MEFMNKKTLIKQLLIYNWDETNINLAIRAKGKCEYCEKNMLESIDNYKLWQVDHIKPRSSNCINFEDFDNKALSCTQCNKDFKGKWNPTSVIGEDKERTEYIKEISKYIKEKREKKQKELDEIKNIFGAYFIENITPI